MAKGMAMAKETVVIVPLGFVLKRRQKAVGRRQKTTTRQSVLSGGCYSSY
jgi:hypothetical protein